MAIRLLPPTGAEEERDNKPSCHTNLQKKTGYRTGSCIYLYAVRQYVSSKIKDLK